MAEYSRLAKGRVLSAGGTTLVSLPFVPDYVEMINYTAANTPATAGVPFAYWDKNMGQGFAVYQTFNATPVLTTNVAVTGGITSLSAGQMLQYGPALAIASVTKDAAAPVVTTSANHGLVSGNVVILQGLYQSATTGMPQICGIPFVVTVTGATTFTIAWNTNQSNYTAYILSGPATSAATLKQVLYPALYVPGEAVIAVISLSGAGSTPATSTDITTTAPHNFQVGQEVAFRITAPWGTTQLNSLPNTTIPGSPVYGFVTAVLSSTSIRVNITSSSFTAFNSNQTVASVPGLKFPQVLAVGDVNMGFGANSSAPAYPSPTVYSGYSTTASATQGSPAILGAYINATFQGFTIGATIAGAATNVLYWRAFLHDYSTP